MPTRRKGSFLEVFAFGPIIYASDTDARITVTMRIGTQSLIDQIVSGESRGLSPEVIVRKWECSICHQDFEECNHIAGEKYSEVKCQLLARDIEFAGSSIVDVPKDHRCRITDLLLIRDENGRRLFEWYGFKVDSESERFKNIQHALEKNLIPQKAAFRFGEFFSINLVGKTSYP